MIASGTQLAQRLEDEVLGPMKSAFVGKDEIIDLLGIALVGGENLFVLGPPGTAKSALVQELGRRLHGTTFEYLLTRFTEPSELFGPFDIRRLREGDLVTNTAGMLPEASLVFLDELLNANSAILNSLLTVLNERVFRRGRETRRIPALTFVGASNHLPEDDALGALFDRFLLRARSDNVPDESLDEVLDAGWRLETRAEDRPTTLSIDDVRTLHGLLPRVALAPVREPYIGLVHALRQAGVTISDRRAVKLQRVIAASALVSGRVEAETSDLWVLRHIWDTEEEADVIASIVDDTIDRATPSPLAHPRSRGAAAPDADALARALARIERDLDDLDSRSDEDAEVDTDAARAARRARLRDRLGALATRCEWVTATEERGALDSRLESLWSRFR